MNHPMHCSLCQFPFNMQVLSQCPGFAADGIDDIDYGWYTVCQGCGAILISQDDRTWIALSDEEMWRLQEKKKKWRDFETYYQQTRSRLQQQAQRRQELLEERSKFRRNKRKKLDDQDFKRGRQGS